MLLAVALTFSAVISPFKKTLRKLFGLLPRQSEEKPQEARRRQHRRHVAGYRPTSSGSRFSPLLTVSSSSDHFTTRSLAPLGEIRQFLSQSAPPALNPKHIRRSAAHDWPSARRNWVSYLDRKAITVMGCLFSPAAGSSVAQTNLVHLKRTKEGESSLTQGLSLYSPLSLPKSSNTCQKWPAKATITCGHLLQLCLVTGMSSCVQFITSCRRL